jgi:hypothetical protein
MTGRKINARRWTGNGRRKRRKAKEENVKMRTLLL